MDVRRVVTGHDADGKAVFVSDTAVAPVTLALLPGSEFHLLWGADEPPRFPDDGSEPPHVTYFPPLGGIRFGYRAAGRRFSHSRPAGAQRCRWRAGGRVGRSG